MKTILIKQLHAETGRWVRAASRQPIVVTDRGVKVASLQPHAEDNFPKPVFSLRRRGVRPKVLADSTVYISEDRDGR
jgi:antitoxin (DNA-binding transcriptional repressor) of toxin-antitoxin stability system